MPSIAATSGRGSVALLDTRGARVRELLLVAGIYAAYEGSRLLACRGSDGIVRARRGATGLLNLGIPADVAFGTLHYLVAPAVLIWLWRQHPHVYRHARTWLGATTVLALVGVACFPAAPSLRVPGVQAAWALWCGVMLVRFARDRTVRTLGLLCPVVVSLVVLGTGDHGRSDILTGVCTVALGGLLADPLQRANARVLGRRPRILSPR